MSVPEDDMIATCFHCGGTFFKTSRWSTYGAIKLIRCGHCDLTHLYPKGLLFVETPDQSSPIAWGIYRGRWLGVATPGHIWAFTSKTLKNVITSANFNVIWHNRWIPYVPDDYPKTIKGQVRRGLFSIINRLGHGDMVGILAQKPY